MFSVCHSIGHSVTRMPCLLAYTSVIWLFTENFLKYRIFLCSICLHLMGLNLFTHSLTGLFFFLYIGLYLRNRNRSTAFHCRFYESFCVICLVVNVKNIFFVKMPIFLYFPVCLLSCLHCLSDFQYIFLFVWFVNFFVSMDSLSFVTHIIQYLAWPENTFWSKLQTRITNAAKKYEKSEINSSLSPNNDQKRYMNYEFIDFKK